MWWLSYGGGINSTALAILMVQNKLPQYQHFKIIFSDTGCERPETYSYIQKVFSPWLLKHGHKLIIVKPKESVIGRWERLAITGNRVIRSCTVEAKIKPIEKFIGKNAKQLVGFSAEESHRAKLRKNKYYPLMEMGIDRQDCVHIIQNAGLCLPIKSGCWCCPFLRVGEVLELIKKHPEKAQRILRLEQAAKERHGDNGRRCQFGNKPMSYWMSRAKREKAQLIMFSALDEKAPCECWS